MGERKMFQKEKTRKRTKKKAEIRKRSYYIRLCVFVFLYALVLVNIFTRYDDETAQNTIELKGAISNVVYDANQGQPWVNFTLQDQHSSMCCVALFDLWKIIKPFFSS